MSYYFKHPLKLINRMSFHQPIEAETLEISDVILILILSDYQ